MKLDAEMHGIKIPETGLIGMPVTIRGKEMKIVDYAANRPKYPIILEDKSGNKIKTTWDTIGFQLLKRNT